MEIAGFLIDDTNPGRLWVPLHQCDGYFEKRCDPFVCSCGNIIESDDNDESHDDDHDTSHQFIEEPPTTGDNQQEASPSLIQNGW